MEDCKKLNFHEFLRACKEPRIMLSQRLIDANVCAWRVNGVPHREISSPLNNRHYFIIQYVNSENHLPHPKFPYHEETFYQCKFINLSGIAYGQLNRFLEAHLNNRNELDL